MLPGRDGRVVGAGNRRRRLPPATAAPAGRAQPRLGVHLSLACGPSAPEATAVLRAKTLDGSRRGPWRRWQGSAAGAAGCLGGLSTCLSDWSLGRREKVKLRGSGGRSGGGGQRWGGWGGPRCPAGGARPAEAAGGRRLNQNCCGPTPDRLLPLSCFFPLPERGHVSCTAGEPGTQRRYAAALRGARECGVPGGSPERPHSAQRGAAGLRAPVARLRGACSSRNAPCQRPSETTASVWSPKPARPPPRISPSAAGRGRQGSPQVSLPSRPIGKLMLKEPERERKKKSRRRAARATESTGQRQRRREISWGRQAQAPRI